jgi:hypothetical protein
LLIAINCLLNETRNKKTENGKQETRKQENKKTRKPLTTSFQVY